MSTSPLVQIQPLSQSGYEQMACGYGYRATNVHGVGRAGSIWADLGQEAHRLISEYINHLVEIRQPTDYDFFDALITRASPEALDGLDRVREALAIDPEKVFGTEQYIGLDKDFSLVVMEQVEHGHRTGGDPRIEYEGTLDLILLHSDREAEIPDWKNHFYIAAPESFQSKLYPLLLFCVMPSLEVVHFRLEYLRWGVNRVVTFTREDLPMLKRMAIAARQRQRKLVELDKEPKATPHKGCIYCPLLLNGCPVDKSNPYAKLSAKERLRLQIYLEAALKVNQAILKEWAQKQTVSVKDENGVTYTGSFVPRQRTRYALDAVLPIVDAWDREHPEDPLRPHLAVGASELNELARAKKKRPELADTLSAVAEVIPYSEFQIVVEPAKRGTKPLTRKSNQKVRQ
jgi:PD-(D/E)XK nuclease superfamily